MKHRIQELLANWLNRPTQPYGTNEAEGLGSIASTVGNVREQNQDRAIIARYIGRYPVESFVFYGLCDGIGGLRDGGICASRGLAAAVLRLIEGGGEPIRSKMMDAAFVANNDIYNRYHENGGCTYSAIGVDFRRESFGINVGDSRIYAREEHQLIQMSSDDNIGNQLQLLGKQDKDSGMFSRQLTQFLGIGQSLQPMSIPLGMRNRGYFITSDGVHSLGDKLLSEISESARTTKELANRTTTVVTWCKGTDNGTAICTQPLIGNVITKNSAGVPGLLEVWDSFEKLQFIVNADELFHSQIATYPSSYAKEPSFTATNYKQSVKKKAIPRKKKADFSKERGGPDIEITESPL